MSPSDISPKIIAWTTHGEKDFICNLHVYLHNGMADNDCRSKLHLVDLAGSERAWKSGIEGQQLSEAKYINLSLHYLESVIIALQKNAQRSSSPR